MNRVIKFRGKPTDNFLDWVHGDLINVGNGRCAIHLLNADGSIEVVPETVSQYTGLKDKNGIEVYEGDILETKYGGVYLLLYNEVECCWSVVHKVQYAIMENDSRSRFNELNGRSLRKSDFDERESIVIGNIHDNKELLNQ